MPGRGAHRIDWGRRFAVAAVLAGALATLGATAARAQEPAPAAPKRAEQKAKSQDPAKPETDRAVREKTAALMERVKTLDPVYREWVQSVAGLISIAELEYFLDL